jgi:hypothetical protein
MPCVEEIDDNMPRTGYGVRGYSNSGFGLYGGSSNGHILIAAIFSNTL